MIELNGPDHKIVRSDSATAGEALEKLGLRGGAPTNANT